ncbi:MAG: OmpA family protein [Proteiniphilum sp.]|nr:OmpA family protein [Proteiniphilum sp.]
MKRTLSYLLLLAVSLTLSCNQAKLSDARGHYLRGEYHAAIDTYRKLYRNTPREERALRGVIAFEMAENYRRLNQSAHALTAYGNAVRFGYPDSLAWLRMAQMLHREGCYPKAADAYRQFLAMRPGNVIATNGLLGAEQAMKGSGQSEKGAARYVIRRMDLFNSSRSDFSPMLAHGDDVLYFTSSREENPGEERSPVTGEKYHDLYLSAKNSRGEWQKPKRIESALNTVFDEGTASVTADGEQMFYSFSAADPDRPTRPGIFFARRVNGIWSAGSRLSIMDGDSLSLFAHPAVSPSGRTLFFVSDMPGGVGGKDLWLAQLDPDNQVVRVENAGTAINTPGDEMFPFLRDDSTLYFSSDGHPGRGGLDLFRAVKSAAGDGWQIEPLPLPLNSPADDFGITFEQGKEKGFFSSNRGDVRGDDHIWAFERVESTIRVEGFVVDREDCFIPGAHITVIGSDGSQRHCVTNREGSYGFTAEEGVEYLFLAQADGFLNHKQALHPESADNDTVCYVDFEMTPYDRPVILEHIFYDFDRADLRSASKAALDALIQLLQEHPEIAVELSAHTDRKGSDAYNDTLSLHRARSVVAYLTANGIGPGRLSSVGYGKSRPMRVGRPIALQHSFLREGEYLTETRIGQLSPEQQAIADQLNRRTEFRVLPPPLFSP